MKKFCRLSRALNPRIGSRSCQAKCRLGRQPDQIHVSAAAAALPVTVPTASAHAPQSRAASTRVTPIVTLTFTRFVVATFLNCRVRRNSPVCT